MTAPDTTWPRPAGPLELRRATPALLDQVLTWRTDPDLTKWLLSTRIDRDAWRAEWLDERDEDYAGVAVLTTGDGDLAVGTGSLWVKDAMGQTHVEHGPYLGAECGISYLIDPAYAGRGYATAVAASLLDLAFDQLGVHRVTAGCFADNIASWKVMEKLGMRREQHGIQDSWHAELGWLDGYTYAILRDEWISLGRRAQR